MNEFVFRFNRRRSRIRGLLFYWVLELAVRHKPVRYHDLIASKRPSKAPPPPDLHHSGYMDSPLGDVGYPFHCHGEVSAHSRLSAARHGRSSGGWARLLGRDRGPLTPDGLIALGCGLATSCR